MFSTRFIAGVVFLFMVIAVIGVSIGEAQGPGRGRLEGVRDPELEITAKHNLEVARWYLTKRKAYEGARDRLKEIIETYPDFSRMDEVLYLMGEAHLNLGETKMAVNYYKKMLEDYPSSEFAKKTQERLDKLKAESDSGNPKKGDGQLLF